MHSVWTRNLCAAVVGLLSLVLVADATAFGHRRRGGGGCGGYGGGYMGGPGCYGNGGYGYGGGYGGGYAGYAPLPAYYGGTYGGAAVNGAVPASQIAPAGTPNASIGPNDRSARANTLAPAQLAPAQLAPAQGGDEGNSNLGAPNAGQTLPSNSDRPIDAGVQGNAAGAGAGANAPPPVAP